MKKYIASVALISLFVGSAFLLLNQRPQVLAGFFPGGGLEEDKEEREEWNRKRLGDPLTGEIPAGIAFLEREFLYQAVQAGRISGGGSTITWNARGPWNVGGRTRAFAIDVTNENRIFAGAVSGGLWKSEDGGSTWTRVSPAYTHPGVVSVAQDTRPGHTDTWYYISGEAYGTSASGGGAFYLGQGMYKSTDGGNTWTQLSATAQGTPNNFTNFYQTGWRIVTNPANATQDEVYACTVGAVYRSVNGGTSWNIVKGGNLGNYSYHTDVACTNTGVIYATLSSDGPDKGVWRSSDGVSWANIVPATGFPVEYDRFVIGINPNNVNEVYFLGSTPNAGFYNNYLGSENWTSLWKYTYLSGNGSGAGGQWVDLSANLPSTGTQFDKFASQGGYDLVVKVQPGSNTVFIGGTNLYRSTDGFTTSNNTTHIGGYKPGTEMPFFELYPKHHPDIHDIAFLPSDPKVLYCASDGGVHRTADAMASNVQWISRNNGYLTTQFYTVAMDRHTPGDEMLMGGLQDNGNFITPSSDPTAVWRMTVNGDGASCAVASDKSAYYFSIQRGIITKCNVDAAGVMTGFERIDPIGASGYLFINPFVLDPNNDDNMYVAGGKKVWRNTQLSTLPVNGGWDSITTGWSVYPDSTIGTISAISVSTANPANKVYFGTDKGRLYRIDNANVGNPTFTNISMTGISGNAYVTCMAVDPTDGNKVVAVYSNYNIYSIYYSENAGTNWKKVAGNLEVNVNGSGNAPSIRWVSILPLSNGEKRYFAGTSVGLYVADSLIEHTANTGTVWFWQDPVGIGTTVVDMIDVRTGDGQVAVATHGNGIFTANLENWVGIQQGQAPASQVSLFPNPTPDFVSVSLKAPHPQSVFTLLDVNGRKVFSRNLTQEETRIDVRHLPSATYYYRVMEGCKWLGQGKLVICQE